MYAILLVLNIALSNAVSSLKDAKNVSRHDSILMYFMWTDPNSILMDFCYQGHRWTRSNFINFSHEFNSKDWISCSWGCPGISERCGTQMRFSWYLRVHKTNARGQVDGPLRTPCQLKKPFKGRRGKWIRFMYDTKDKKSSSLRRWSICLQASIWFVLQKAIFLKLS